MAVKEVLLDTNAYVAFKQGRTEAVDIVRRASQVALNSVVIGELLAGFAVGSREAKNRAELQQFLAFPQVLFLQIHQATADSYASIHRTLRHKGRPIPTNDMWIAASALHHHLARYSDDKHFRQI